MRTLKLSAISLLCVSFLLASGCESQLVRDLRMRNDSQQKRIDTLQAEKSALELELGQLQRKLEAAESISNIDLEKLKEQIAALNENIRTKDALIASMRENLRTGGAALPVELSTLLEEFAKSSDMVTYDSERGIVKFKSDLLFDKGSDQVASTSVAAIKSLCGILNTEKTEQEIVTYLTNGFFYAPTREMMHVFGTLLTPEQITALAMFIKQGMVDSSPYFGMDTIINGSLANFENGEYLYSFRGFAAPTAGCELCHNADGLGEQGVNLGDIANTNPWEFLHKIRFGQPATAMPAMFDAEDANGFLLFDIQDAVDVIQYSQSLP